MYIVVVVVVVGGGGGGGGGGGAAVAAAVGAGRDVIKGRGKIQGDGRKFLDRFKSYFGSQISSQSLNEVNIYQLQPKSATKRVFSNIFVFDCFELASWIANGERSRRSSAR